ncbi:outer membrane protein assembly factor BamB family protein [Limnoglobus roseus]|uniref:Serine/threonine protein kinase n=1 Tax=Limnoglobus roseus TaxID=2598579 RepID=A0A5C1AA76_9BACT|nr:PQQ-binding-like beta-propeller repeat protein [Limnoglobus roseus]QEL15107.1 serine/threonine protein kinase [Limnoglobus roseus]
MNLILLSVLLAADPTPVQVWPGFRGDGTSTSTAKNLPLTWSPTENLAWRTPLPGYGQSSPVVWEDLVFVTAIDGAEKEKLLVVAVDAKTGKAAWTKEFAATQKGKNNPMMSRAAPTPVVDADAVYAFFESGDVVALSHAGEVRWERSLSKEYGAFKNNHGVGSSPAQTDKAVVVLIDDLGPSYLVALDKATGKNVWKADRPSRVSWTSPVVTKIDGKPAVLVSSSGSLTAYDATTGKELVSLSDLVGNTIPSPAVVGDLVVLGAGENRTEPDLAASAKSNCCLRLVVKGDKTSFEPVWDGKKAISHHASPLVHKGHAYFVTKTGLVHCVDLKTGAEHYAERLDNPCWATPVGAGDHVFFFGKDGVTTVLLAGSEFEKVASNRFWSAADFGKRQDEAKEKAASTLPKPPEGKGPGGGPPLPKAELEATRYSAVGDVVYGVAAVDGTFFVRTGTELICVRDTIPTKRP